jgi:hypothetical protein
VSERKIFTIADIPEEERSVGTDLLWQENPAARAYYSGRPDFTEGAATDIYPYHSLLIKPAVAEALEQIYLERHAVQSGADPVEPELALSGLELLKGETGHLGKASDMRRSINRQYNRLEPQVTAKREAAARQAENLALFRRAEERKRHKAEAEAAHQARCEREMADAVTVGEEYLPHVNFGRLSELTAELYSTEGPGGEIIVKESKHFNKIIAKRAAEYLEDPSAMVNDFTALAFLHIAAEQDGELATVLPYADRVDAHLADAVDQLAYEDLSEEIMDRWLDPTDKLDPEYQAEPDTDKDNRSRNLATSAILVARGGVLIKSFASLSRREPRKFLDRLHTFAGKGLDTANLAKREVALSVISRCLSEPLTYQLVMRGTMAAPFVDEKNGPAHVRQALDLNATLDGFGVRLAQRSISELSDEERHLVDEVYPVAAMVSAVHASRARSLHIAPDFEASIRMFKERALTPEGRASTLYGRLADIPGAS